MSTVVERVAQELRLIEAQLAAEHRSDRPAGAWADLTDDVRGEYRQRAERLLQAASGPVRRATPQPCTTSGRKGRHYSVNLAPVLAAPGRRGTTLCGVEAHDAEYANRPMAWPRKTVDLNVLRECRVCAKAAERVSAL